MSPPDERHYEALSRIDTEVKYIAKMIDTHLVDNKEEHQYIKATLDIIKYDLNNCPHARVVETEKQIEALWGWIKIIIIAGGSTLTGVVLAIVNKMIGGFK